MSVDVNKKSGEVAAKPDLVTLTIDDTQLSVPKGTLIIRAAEMIGTAIPRFCDHPLLDPVGACRQCMVEIPDAGNGRGFPKPQPSCTMPVAEGMVVKTQLTSPVAQKAQNGILELLLINHPLDCPICDKGGECPLQNQTLSSAHAESRYEGMKRTYPKPVSVSANILLDRERCILCARCTRFSEQISGDPFITLVERGALQQVGFYEDEPYDSYFSGNIIQICPVGALTSAAYRFQSRPFDLVSTTTTCEHCSSGEELRVDHRHFQVKRRLAGDDPQVNEEWINDKCRFAFMYGRGDDRLKYPLVKRDGVLEPASWPEAIDAAVSGLKAAKNSVGVLTGGRLLWEASYGYAKFARTVLGTNSIDFRSRPASKEEADFLATNVAWRDLGSSVKFSDIDNAKHVVLVSFEPEDEAGAVFLRLRKAVRKSGLKVSTIAPFLSWGSEKLSATLIPARPGEEAQALYTMSELDASCLILVGERAAISPGALSAVSEVSKQTGARFAWIPRRAGDIGAVAAGCLPQLLPGGRQIDDSVAMQEIAQSWGEIPHGAGLDAEEMFQASLDGKLKALMVAGLQLNDFANPTLAKQAIKAIPFLVSIETRRSEVVESADVVLPVALIEEQSGSFLNWEHRERDVRLVIQPKHNPMTDLRVLAALADAMGSDLGLRGAAEAQQELRKLTYWTGPLSQMSKVKEQPVSSGIKLASWRFLLDDAAAMDNEPHLAQTKPKPVAKISAGLAQKLGNPTEVTVTGPKGSLTRPVTIAKQMVDDVVWLPGNSGAVLADVLGAGAGSVVTITGGTK